MDLWRPVNEAEVMMYHALLRGDDTRFFQTVVDAPLYLAAVGRRLISWDRDGRTHLLAFTSPEGLARCLGTDADSIVATTYPQLVRDWPDPEWWLALNPTLPIDAVLPVQDVVAAARGDVEIPMPSVGSAPVGAAAAAPTGTGAPVNELEEAMAEVLEQGNIALLLDLLVFAEVLVPVDGPESRWYPLPLSPDHPVDEPAVGVFTSPERLAEATGGIDVPTVRASLVEIALAWPGPEYALHVNPESTLRARLPGDQVAGLPEWARISAHYHGLPVE